MNYNTGNIDKYMTKNPLKRRMVQKLNQKIISTIGGFLSDDIAGTSILDAGCGEGFIDALMLKNYPDMKITGIEYTSEAIQIAKQMNPSVKYIQGDITNIQLEDNNFDIVLCTEVLEHINHPETAFNEILRVSKKHLLITVPHEPWFRVGNLLVLKNFTRLGNPIDHINHWNINSFRRFINENLDNNSYLNCISSCFPWIVAEIIKK